MEYVACKIHMQMNLALTQFSEPSYSLRMAVCYTATMLQLRR